LKTHKNLFEDAPLRDPPTASSILTFNTKSAATGVKYSALSQLNELDETLHDNKSRQEEEITSRDKVHLAVLSRNSFSLIADDEDGGSHGDEDEESLFGMKEGDEKKRDILPLSMTADETRELSITSAESLSPLEEAEDKRDQSTEKVKEGAEEGEREEKPEEDGEDGEEEEEVVLSYRSSMIYLGVITVFIAILSEIISSTIETAASSLHLSGIFIATIVLPIVGNAAEHTSAIVFAMKNKLNLTLGIAIGSSTQIALCVLPLVVILGWMSDLDMSLEFGYYESVCLFVSVFCLTIALKDGESNWFVGLTMIVAYVIIAMGFFVHKNSSLSADEGR
jgi:Ca2+/Na+ antiporter